jgi:hypothetical protein
MAWFRLLPRYRLRALAIIRQLRTTCHKRMQGLGRDEYAPKHSNGGKLAKRNKALNRTHGNTAETLSRLAV